jgi:hypothetical protein
LCDNPQIGLHIDPGSGPLTIGPDKKKIIAEHRRKPLLARRPLNSDG